MTRRTEAYGEGACNRIWIGWLDSSDMDFGGLGPIAGLLQTGILGGRLKVARKPTKAFPNSQNFPFWT